MPITNSGYCTVVYLGVQSREKFCFEDELREYVNADFMEVHVAFSRDSRGLAYDPHNRELVERQIPPRYIDTLIVEQGATITDLVMSKKQGGLGGYLYVCGSVAVFDSVMSGIRKAIYTHCTATMENVDLIVNKAFAERRLMLDVFMTPKPLPCNLPTIPVSQLALHTGHRPGSRMWIGVHGSVYDVTDFCPMHPGGTQIIKSNAGVDCTKSFDNLAHTNNPEVASLLTKYFVGHLTPKPDFQTGNEDMSTLYDLWAGYLRTTVETLVAHQIEMHELQGASLDASSSHDRQGIVNIWLREELPNTIAIRTFYEYQSRLLQGGFSALFGAKLQELVLKLSFGLANASGPGANLQFPDVLGAVARAKTSSEAVTCTNEVALVGQFVCGAEDILRFQERGVFAYACRSVELDIELLEDLRREICTGMDAFDSIASSYGGGGGSHAPDGPQGEGAADDDYDDADDDDSRLAALAAFLLQILERVARRLGVFYAQLAQCSVYRPELERNPARARWALVRRCIWDGSLFVLAHEAEANVLAAAGGRRQQRQQQKQSPAYYTSRANANQRIDFDNVMSQVRDTLLGPAGRAEMMLQRQQQQHGPAAVPREPPSLNAVHRARARSGDTGDASAVATRENAGALRAMSSFVEKNSKAIRRLSKMPPLPMSFEELQRAAAASAAAQQHGGGMHTPPPDADAAESAAMLGLLGMKGGYADNNNMLGHHHHHNAGGARLPTPPSSLASSRSPSRTRYSSSVSGGGMSHSAEMLLSKLNQSRARQNSFHRRPSPGHSPSPSNAPVHHHQHQQQQQQQQQQQRPLYPVVGGAPAAMSGSQQQQTRSMHAALSSMAAGGGAGAPGRALTLNTRRASVTGHIPVASSLQSHHYNNNPQQQYQHHHNLVQQQQQGGGGLARTRSLSSTRSTSRGRARPGHASMQSTNSIRAFRLGGLSEEEGGGGGGSSAAAERRVAPTF